MADSEHSAMDVEPCDLVHHRLRREVGRGWMGCEQPVASGPRDCHLRSLTRNDRTANDVRRRRSTTSDPSAMHTSAPSIARRRAASFSARYSATRGSSGSSMLVGALTRPVASRTVRRCSRPGCGAQAVVLIGFDAARSLAWFAPLDDDGALHGSELCHRHADSMVLPKGWWLDDRRVASPQLFNPPPNPPAPPPFAHSTRSEPAPVSKPVGGGAVAVRGGSRVSGDGRVAPGVRQGRRPRRPARRRHAPPRAGLQRPASGTRPSWVSSGP